MSTPESESGVQWRIEKWFPDLDRKTLDQFKIFFDELLKFNKTINLISVKTIIVADILHFSDCIMACRIINDDCKASAVVDLGSGNGFPGIIYGILFPNVKVALIESDLRKCDFLKSVVSTLKLSNITVVNQMIEKLPNSSVEVGIARAFGSLSKTLLTTRKAVKYPGVVYHMKTDNWGIELAEVPSQLCSMFDMSLLSEYRLPVGELKFAIIKTKKIKAD